MPGSTYALTALRNDLEGADLIRRPSSVGDLPPAFVEPAGGAPAPGERDGPEAGGNLVVTLRLSSEIGQAPGAALLRLFVFDLIYRSKTTAGLQAGRALDAAIRARLVEGATYGTGIILDEGGTNPLFVHQLSQFAGLGPVSDLAGVRTEQSKIALLVAAS